MESQNTQIKSYLESGHTLTAHQALDLFGTFRLAARVHDLKAMGFPIDKNMIPVGPESDTKYVAQYIKKPPV